MHVYNGTLSLDFILSPLRIVTLLWRRSIYLITTDGLRDFHRASPGPLRMMTDDSEGDILFFEELLSNDSPSLHENESFHFDVPSSPRPPAKPPDDGIYFEPDTRVFTKVVDDISELYVHVPNVLTTLPTSPMFDTLQFHFHPKMRTKFISYLIGALILQRSFLIFLKAR
ncbi:hypothetical protein Tco_0660539 [Tanacetum coccineum]